ncbi:hypothetical protein D3C87_1414820 [compost metagenome]
MQADPRVVHQKIEALLVEVGAQHLVDFGGKRGELLTLSNIELQHGGAAAEAFNFRDQGLRLIGAAVVGADDVDALGGQMQRGVLAEAAAGAGDQCDFTVHGASSSAVGSGWEEVYLSATG